MISKVISISEKVNMLPDIFDMLLFTWIIPHTDDFGRLAGSPAKVKALVVPMLDKSIRDVSESLKRLQDQGLILWYEVEGEKVIQVINFEKHQQGLHKRTRSKFPDPPSHSGTFQHFPGNSGNFPNFPPEGKGTEGNRTEEKGIEEEGKGTDCTPDFSESRDSILKLCNQCNVQKVNISALEDIYSFIGVLEQPVIEKAVKKAQDKHINYAINTLKGWVSEGKTTLEQVSPPPKVTPFKGRAHDKPEMAIVEQAATTETTPEEMNELMRLAQMMKGASHEKEHDKEPA